MDVIFIPETGLAQLVVVPCSCRQRTREEAELALLSAEPRLESGSVCLQSSCFLPEILLQRTGESSSKFVLWQAAGNSHVRNKSCEGEKGGILCTMEGNSGIFHCALRNAEEEGYRRCTRGCPEDKQQTSQIH